MDFSQLSAHVASRGGSTRVAGPSLAGSSSSGAAQASNARMQRGSIVIAIMGVTGSGKSTFIEHFSAQAKIGHTLQSCTSQVEVHPCRLSSGVEVHLVDTPGFDDSNATDANILRELATWFSETYGQGIYMTGIVYLHRILDTRVTGAGIRTLNMFKKLVGRDCLSNVVLATTMWDTVHPEDIQKAENREAQLKSTFWKEMVDYGSRVVRKEGPESALEIVQTLIQRSRQAALDIQVEMVDKHKTLDQTAAGQTLQLEIEKAEIEFQKKLQRLKDEFAQAGQKQDHEHQRRIAENRAKLEQRLQLNKKAAEQLKANREQLKQKIKSDANKEVEQTASQIRNRDEGYERAGKLTEQSGYWRHPDCYNHWPHDPWHQSHCNHPMYQ